LINMGTKKLNFKLCPYGALGEAGTSVPVNSNNKVALGS